MRRYSQKGGSKITIDIAEEVWKVWDSYRQVDYSSHEACGVLIGSFDESAAQIMIKACTSPLKNDSRSRSTFVLKDGKHQQAVDSAYQESDGYEFYLGTWHTHPEANPSPSNVDRLDWHRCIERNPNLPYFVFAIVGTESVSLFPTKGKANE